MLLGRFYIDSFRVVNRSVGIADPNDLDAALVRERESCDRTDVSEALHDSGAFFGVYLQDVHGALDQVNHAAASRFAAAFRSPDGDRFARDDLAD